MPQRPVSRFSAITEYQPIHCMIRGRSLPCGGWSSTIVDLPEAERAQLDALCRQRGLSRAEALRQALRLWLEQQKPSHGEVFGLWRDRPEGSLELQQALRQEWDAP